MSRVLLAWASRYGQTGRVAARLQAVLENAGHDVTSADLGGNPSGVDPRDFDACVIGCPIYVGRHLRSVKRFVQRHRAPLNERPGAFFSVSLAASDAAGSGRVDAQRVVDSFVADTGWTPAHVVMLGGALPYRRYNLITRMIMKHIVRKAGGTTDTSRNHEVTDWPAVDAFGRELARALG